MKAGTQADRLYRFLREHPNSSTLEIQQALHLTNATGRISDLRAELQPRGQTVERIRRPDGRDGYRLAAFELTLGLAS